MSDSENGVPSALEQEFLRGLMKKGLEGLGYTYPLTQTKQTWAEPKPVEPWPLSTTYPFEEYNDGSF